jgi:hypothetical protein
MNIEELKLVLDTVATVTDDAKSVAIWYFVFNYGASFILKLVGMVVFVWLAWTITRAVLSTNEWAKIGVKVIHSWGGYGSSTYSDPNDSSCTRAMDDCLTAAKDRNK